MPKTPTLPTVTLWHNPACSKSRRALEILKEVGCEVEVFAYLSTPPTVEQLKALLAMLAAGPRAIVRHKEALYAELGLASADDAALLEALAAHPTLIERPIGVVVERQTAVVARPPELIVKLLIPEVPAGIDENELVRRTIQGKLVP